MRPIEYFSANVVAVEQNVVFTLLPSELEQQYKKYIKSPLEGVVTEYGRIECHSYLDIYSGENILANVWQEIQRANVIIAIVTGFKPNIMFELGVVLTKKENVIILAEDTVQDQAHIPFNIINVKVEFYNSRRLKKLSQYLCETIARTLKRENLPVFESDDIHQGLLQAVDERNRGDFQSSSVALEKLIELHPDEALVNYEAGISFKLAKRYDKSHNCLYRALQLSESNVWKAKVQLEIAKMHFVQEQYQSALDALQRAEYRDKSSADLYVVWASILDTIGNTSEACKKIEVAKKLSLKIEINELYEYYNLKNMDRQFDLTFSQWMSSKCE